MAAKIQIRGFPAVIEFCTAGADFPDHGLGASTKDSNRGKIAIVCCYFGKNAFDIGAAKVDGK